MSGSDAWLSPITLVVGPEALLSERAVGTVCAAARAVDAEADVSELPGSELTPAVLAEQLSPSLFATRRVLVVRAVQDVGDQAAAALVRYAADPEPETHLVLVH